MNAMIRRAIVLTAYVVGTGAAFSLGVARGFAAGRLVYELRYTMDRYWDRMRPHECVWRERIERGDLVEPMEWWRISAILVALIVASMTLGWVLHG